jgi:hypothetical protein
MKLMALLLQHRPKGGDLFSLHGGSLMQADLITRPTNSACDCHQDSHQDNNQPA